MGYLLFTESLKDNELVMLEKFIDMLLYAVMSGKYVYIDGIGTFYINKHSDSSYGLGHPDELLLLPAEKRIKESIDFENLKKASKCSSILKEIKSKLKEGSILDIPELGTFTVDSTITFTQSYLLEKRINKDYENASNDKIDIDKILSNIDGIVEDINEDLDDIDEKDYEYQKIKDYEELEEEVYNDYKNKILDTETSPIEKRINEVTLKEKIISKKNNVAMSDAKTLKDMNTIFSLEPKKSIVEENENKEDLRSLFTSNLNTAIKNTRTKELHNKKRKGNVKIHYFLMVFVVIFISFALASAFFVMNNMSKNEMLKSDDNNIYNLVDNFYKTYKATMLSIKIPRDMYLWEISKEVYDNPLYWPLLYAGNNIEASPTAMIAKGSVLSYRDLKITGKYSINIIHKFRLNDTLSKSYLLLYPILLKNNENKHAIWSLRLSYYFSNLIFEKNKAGIEKDVYEKVLMDRKNYAKRSL